MTWDFCLPYVLWTWSDGFDGTRCSERRARLAPRWLRLAGRSLTK
jgi:hypothetical protein